MAAGEQRDEPTSRLREIRSARQQSTLAVVSVELAQGIEIPGGARGLAALPVTLGVADRSGRVWGCCAQLAEAVGAS